MDTEVQTLKEEAQQLVEEARMVLPGIQALFGFQLIVVFNDSFSSLSSNEQIVHFISLLLIVAAIALIMTPAAYHRIAEPDRISRYFVSIASTLIAAATIPLLLGITLDVFVISQIIVKDALISCVIAGGVSILFVALWYGLPVAHALKTGDLGRNHATRPRSHP